MPRSRLAATLRAFVPIARPNLRKEYDVIVVGSGSGGSTLAYRLSENPDCRVLMIEAGPQDSSPWIHIPVGYFTTIGKPKYDWCLETDSSTTGLNGRSLKWPRGKVLGGSSCLNGLLYVRGLAMTYDNWAAMGNKGWSYEEVLPYFKRAQDGIADLPETNGIGGPQSVMESTFKSDLAERWSQACAETCGVERLRDLNAHLGGPGGGAGVAYFTNLKTPDGFRCSSAIPIHEIRNERPNLHVMLSTDVERVLFEGNRAVGVETSDGTVRVGESGEVVLSAGALGSPHILMKSGVGDSEELAAAGVHCRHHLPGVGKNLQDHLQLRPKFRVKAKTLNTQIQSLWGKGMAGVEFFFNRSGPLSMAASQVNAIVPSVKGGVPDLQFHFQPLSAKAGNGTVQLDSFDAFTASVCILRPSSKGSVSLRRDKSLCISPQYLTTEDDQQLALRSLQLAQEISKHALMQEIGATEVEMEAEPTLEYAQRVAETIYHPASTCSMGNQPESVVDEQLRVHGIEGLRVVDCSIMPEIASGNTHAPTVMIAEKAADMMSQ